MGRLRPDTVASRRAPGHNNSRVARYGRCKLVCLALANRQATEARNHRASAHTVAAGRGKEKHYMQKTMASGRGPRAQWPKAISNHHAELVAWT